MSSTRVLLAVVSGLMFLAGCNSTFLGGGKNESDQLVEDVEVTVNEQKRAELLKKIDRDFENPDAHYELGQLYQSEGMWFQAEREYSIALGFDPVHREAQGARVKVLVEGGDQGQADLSADFYINQVSQLAAGSLRLAMAFQNNQLDELALRCYHQALRLAPNSAKINRQIGFYHLSKDDKQQAGDYLTRSFQLDPHQPGVAFALGKLGVAVQVPRKTEKNTKKLDKIIESGRRTE